MLIGLIVFCIVMLYAISLYMAHQVGYWQAEKDNRTAITYYKSKSQGHSY